jgi:hypothetical protein
MQSGAEQMLGRGQGVPRSARGVRLASNATSDAWAMEVYVGEKHDQKGGDMDENTIEFDLDDDDEAEMASKFLAIAVFYSRKSFNAHILF